MPSITELTSDLIGSPWVCVPGSIVWTVEGEEAALRGKMGVGHLLSASADPDAEVVGAIRTALASAIPDVRSILPRSLVEVEMG